MTVSGNDGLVDIWGSSASDIYAVRGATALHYDGES